METAKKIPAIIRSLFGNRKRLTSIIGIILIVAIVFFTKDASYGAYLKYVRSHDNELKIGFVTDIHAGNKASKEKGSGLIYPMHFRENMTSALDDMRNDDYIVTLGDNLDVEKGCQKYIDELHKMTKNFDVLWTKGNHDKDACFPSLESRGNYYSVDVKDWRLVVLDNSSWYTDEERASNGSQNRIGSIDAGQMAWLKDSLKTDKKILIAIHVPIWDDNGNGNYSMRTDYLDLKKMLEDSGNVKYVLSGHYHNDDWKHEENGITYYILPSIEQEGSEGYHMTLKLE
ncbi:MAG: metallophosphoesterase [Candidatus Moraniibacteriota bacterium]